MCDLKQYRIIDFTPQNFPYVVLSDTVICVMNQFVECYIRLIFPRKRDL